jgi:peroxiredoxin
VADSKLKIGDSAPDFTLKDNHGREVTLGELRGKKIVLGFHPLAWTSVCSEQMKGLEANFDRFEKLNTVAFGLSIDSTFCKKAWAESLGIEKTRLLSDFWPHGKVASDYGVYRESDGFSERAVIIVAEDGVVAFLKVYPIKEVPDIDEIIAQLEKI